MNCSSSGQTRAERKERKRVDADRRAETDKGESLRIISKHKKMEKIKGSVKAF